MLSSRGTLYTLSDVCDCLTIGPLHARALSHADAILGVEFFFNFGVSASRDSIGEQGAGIYDPSTCWYYSLHRPWVDPQIATPWGANRSGDKEIIDHVTGRGQCFGTEYFGTFFRSWYTLFQVLTTESWAEAIGRPIGFHWPYGDPQSPMIAMVISAICTAPRSHAAP